MQQSFWSPGGKSNRIDMAEEKKIQGKEMAQANAKVREREMALENKGMQNNEAAPENRGTVQNARVPEDKSVNGGGKMEKCLGGNYAAVQGMIVEILPDRETEAHTGGCLLYASVEDMDGNLVTFLITPDTFVVDWETLEVGKNCIFWYSTDAPAPLIYPPRYHAVVAAVQKNSRMVDVSYYDQNLVNREHMLQLKLDRSVKMRMCNNQLFLGNPEEHDLVVIYENSTRSIPAQTTPKEIIVLCNLHNMWGEE